MSVYINGSVFESFLRARELWVVWWASVIHGSAPVRPGELSTKVKNSSFQFSYVWSHNLHAWPNCPDA